MSEFDDLMRQKAVALKYNPDKNGAPVIVASGMGYLAEKITETAMAAGVPVYEDDSLATLLTQLKLGAEIPEELYQAIVDIYIYFLGYVPGREEGEAAQTDAAPAGTEDGGGLAGDAEQGAGDFYDNMSSGTAQTRPERSAASRAGAQHTAKAPGRTAGAGQASRAGQAGRSQGTGQGLQNTSKAPGRSRASGRQAAPGASARSSAQNAGQAGRGNAGRTGARGQGTPGRLP